MQSIERKRGSASTRIHVAGLVGTVRIERLGDVLHECLAIALGNAIVATAGATDVAERFVAGRRISQVECQRRVEPRADRASRIWWHRLAILTDRLALTVHRPEARTRC